MAEWRMRRTPSVLVLAFVLGACAGDLGPGPWTKAGADEATTAQDVTDCHVLARQEALRRYPHGYSVQTAGPAATVMSQQNEETSRFLADAEAFDRCMRGKGYAQSPAAAR
ncbi:MAG: hypothetical protein ACOY4R_28970 [Pseudomonadota bacterium]